MKRQLGSKSTFCAGFETEPAQRDDPMEMLRCMGRSVAHIHISDHDDSRDCLVPGQGKTDFRELIQELNRLEYDGGLILSCIETISKLHKNCLMGNSFASFI